MELRQLRTFEAVLRHGTVTDAAVALGLAPSSVSAQIRALEAALGVALFDRKARGMELTGAGERLRAWSRRLLDDADRAAREVVGSPELVRFGALETVAATCVPPVLERLRERCPDLKVEVRPEASRATLLTDVVAGALDAAMVLDTGTALGDLGFPVPEQPLTFVDLGAVPLVLVAAPDHPLRERTHLSPADCRSESLLVNVPTCSFCAVADRVFDKATTRVLAGGVAVMRAWAEQGLGISLLPRFAVAQALAAGSLVRLDLAVPDLALRLVWRADREASVPGLRDVLYAAAA